MRLDTTLHATTKATEQHAMSNAEMHIIFRRWVGGVLIASPI